MMDGMFFALVLWFNHGGVLVGYHSSEEACIAASKQVVMPNKPWGYETYFSCAPVAQPVGGKQ